MRHKLLRSKNKKGLVRNISSKCRISGVSLLALFMAMTMLSPIVFLATPVEAVDPPSEPHIWTTDGFIHGTGFLENHNVDIYITGPDGTEYSGSTMTDSDGNFVYKHGLSGLTGEYLVEATDGTNSAETSFTGSYYYSFRYEVKSYSDPGYSVQEDDFAQGDVVFAKGVKTRGRDYYLRLEFYDPSNNLKHTCTTPSQTDAITCVYLLPDDAHVGEWTIKFYAEYRDDTPDRLRATDHFNVGTAGEEPGEEPPEENVIINLYYITSGDLTATFSGEAGGSVSYWIEDIEVKGEFSKIWGFVNNLNNKLASTKITADTAFLIATVNDREVEEHGQTLVLHYDMINDTYKKLYILRNEIVAFEGHYFDFVNETNSTLGIYGENIQFQGGEISALQAKVNSLNGIIALIRNSLIGLGLLAGALYLVNRRYPLGEIVRNGNGFFGNGRQYKIGEFVQKTKPAREPNKALNVLRYKIARVRRMRIRRNPEKSPLQVLKRIRRNPEKSLLRSLFPFLFFNK